MNVMNQIAEARATTLTLRASAKACGPEQRALKFRLVRAAESLDAIVLIAVRGIERVEQLELALRLTVAALEGKPCRQQALDDARAVLAAQGGIKNATGALMITRGSNLDTEDCELILRALDVLDLLMAVKTRLFLAMARTSFALIVLS